MSHERYREFDAWDRKYEAAHPEEYYCGFHLMPVICVDLITGAMRPMIDIYDPVIGTFCTVSNATLAKGWIDGQLDIAGRPLDDFLSRRLED